MNQSLPALVSDYFDHTLSGEAAEKLASSLATEVEARREFVRAALLHRQLHDFLRKGAKEFRDAKVATPARPLRWPSLGFVRLTRSLTASIGVIALVVYGTFVLISWNLRPDAALVQNHLPPVSMAQLSEEHNCRWESDSSSPKINQPLPPQELRLASGLAKISFADGATVILEGPSHLALESPGRAHLYRGKLVARVPSRAIGFTIDTDTTRIVDLGTEFGVETNQRGVTEVQVFEGKLKLSPNVKQEQTSTAWPAITLTAGDARKIEPISGVVGSAVREIPVASEHFVRQIPSTKTRQITPVGALASSEWPTCEVRHLIDGSGLHGDRHDAVATDTMWLTMLRRVKNEFVLFDLGRFYRLESMKVWNHNDSFGGGPPGSAATRGVKQADIYVSTSGKWDPLTRPDEWKLVVENRQFAAATGKPDYASPERIMLDNVEARFVAIVIDHRLLEVSPENDCVGLSEVQFFGEKTTASRSSTGTVARQDIAGENYVNRERTQEHLSLNLATVPAKIPGLVLWLDADSGAQKVDGREAIDGTEVVEWKDRTDASNNTVAEDVTKNRDGNPGPIFVASGIGGRPALRFAGPTIFSRLENNTQNLLKAGSPRSVAVVGLARASDPGPLFTFQQGLPHFEVGFHSSDDKLDVYGSEKLYFFGQEKDPGKIASINIAYLSTLQSPFVAIVESSGVGGTLQISLNGVTPSMTSNEIATEDAANVGFTVGAVYRNPASWNGLISEILVYDHVLSESERNSVGYYLSSKYQIRTSFTATSPK